MFIWVVLLGAALAIITWTIESNSRILKLYLFFQLWKFLITAAGIASLIMIIIVPQLHSKTMKLSVTSYEIGSLGKDTDNFVLGIGEDDYGTQFYYYLDYSKQESIKINKVNIRAIKVVPGDGNPRLEVSTLIESDKKKLFWFGPVIDKYKIVGKKIVINGPYELRPYDDPYED